MKGSARAKELCASRMLALFPMARPLMSALKSPVKALNSPRVGPRSKPAPPSRLRRIERMACVAHALGMTWLAKKSSGAASGLTTGRSSFSDLYLKRKIRP